MVAAETVANFLGVVKKFGVIGAKLNLEDSLRGVAVEEGVGAGVEGVGAGVEAGVGAGVGVGVALMNLEDSLRGVAGVGAGVEGVEMILNLLR